jgi:hypothetical protein
MQAQKPRRIPWDLIMSFEHRGIYCDDHQSGGKDIPTKSRQQINDDGTYTNAWNKTYLKKGIVLPSSPMLSDWEASSLERLVLVLGDIMGMGHKSFSESSDRSKWAQKLKTVRMRKGLDAEIDSDEHRGGAKEQRRPGNSYN